jgi:hypothetical protein
VGPAGVQSEQLKEKGNCWLISAPSSAAKLVQQLHDKLASARAPVETADESAAL